MKELNSFLNEGSRKNKKEKEKSPHPVKSGEESSDKEFLSLMDEYKVTRRKDPKAAAKVLKQAQSLKGVSRRAKLAAAYL